MRLLKGIVVLLAVIGVLAMLLAARGTARPLTPISSLNPAMNFAYVRVHGLVVDYPYIEKSGDYLSFSVRDESGDVRVMAYRSVIDALVVQRRLPMPGTVVTVEGTLRVRENEPALTLGDVEAIDSYWPVVQKTSLSHLPLYGMGECVVVVGQIRRKREVQSAYQVVSLRNGSDQIDVLVPLQLSEFIKLPSIPDVGTWVQVTGSVSEYRGTPELLVRGENDITEIPAQTSSTNSVASLSSVIVGSWAMIDGIVNKVQLIHNGVLLDLKSATGKDVSVVMYEEWNNVPFSSTLQSGDAITVQGEVVSYRGKLEVQPELSIDLVKH